MTKKFMESAELNAALKMDHPGPWTADEVFTHLVHVMGLQPGLQDAMSILDYADGERIDDWAQRPMSINDWEDLYWIQPIVSTGSSEGVYVDVALRCLADSRTRNFGTFKTLNDDLEAYALMGQIAGVLVELYGRWLWANRSTQEAGK